MKVRIKEVGEPKIKIEPFDIWNVDITLSKIIVPVLKHYRDNSESHGIVDVVDIPTRIVWASRKDPNAPPVGDERVMSQIAWNYILNEMIWAFTEQAKDDEPTFYHEEQKDPSWKQVAFLKEHVYYHDAEGDKQYNERKQNGFRLFGKYFTSLWS